MSAEMSESSPIEFPPYPRDPNSIRGQALARRGTTNSNARGSAEDRRRRKEWLIQTYRANVDVKELTPHFVFGVQIVALGQGYPAARCYRCGMLCTTETITVDRIKPGCEGGTYARHNIRPACGVCNPSTGGVLGNARKRAKK